MKKKSILAIAIAFVMLFTVFIVKVPDSNAATASTYWIKVNTQASVVTVYKQSGSQYVPYRAMLCSAGKKGSETPTGTYKLGTKIGWCRLVGYVWGQYSMVIKGDYLFHSVPFNKKSKSSMNVTEFNKLGTARSHGCVRLCTMDVKWIWDNCPKGTKITVYKSSDPGPLGKPEPIKMSSSWKWDPTDPDSKNPNFSMRMPEITVAANKSTVVPYGANYDLKKGVTAKNLNAIQDLTSAVKVNATYKWDAKSQKYVKADFSTTVPGSYKIVYSAYDAYCGGTGYKNFYVRVVDEKTPVIAADDREVTLGSGNAKNAVKGVAAKQKTKIRTKYIITTITDPDGIVTELSYNEARKFVFDKEGTYQITYRVSDYYGSGRVGEKTISVICKAKEQAVNETVPTLPEVGDEASPTEPSITEENKEE